MNDVELDRILSQTEAVEPSDAFVASVMNAVAREGAPSPLAFPWLRALPAFIGLAVSLGAIVVFVVRAALATGASAPPFAVTMTLDATQSYIVGWIAVALVVSFASMLVPFRLTRVGGLFQ